MRYIYFKAGKVPAHFKEIKSIHYSLEIQLRSHIQMNTFGTVSGFIIGKAIFQYFRTHYFFCIYNFVFMFVNRYS